MQGEYRVGHQEQLYIENQAMIAEPRPDGGITITGSMQCPYYVHEALKRALGLSDTQAVITQAETGGGFGGKEDFPSVVAIHAALLAQRVGKPVRMIYDRHEDIASTTKRHPAIVRYRSGVAADGSLVAQDVEVIMDGGAYCTSTPVVLSRGVLHAGGPYECPNVRIRGRAMATNTPPNGAFRGFGAPQTEFAAELQVARIADELGISPAALRRALGLSRGRRHPHRAGAARERRGGRGAGAGDGGSRVRARPGGQPADPRRALGPGGGGWSWLQVSTRVRSASGIGLAMAWHGAGFTGRGEINLASVAGVELGADGVVRILIANTEIGQGTNTVMPMIVAEALGIDPDERRDGPHRHVDRARQRAHGRLAHGHGRRRPGHHRRSAACGPSSRSAAVAASPTTYQGGCSQLTVPPAWTSTSSRSPTSTSTRRPTPAMPTPRSAGPAPSPSVDVDLDTGEVRVKDVVSADDVGRVIHPVLAEGQVEGGTLQSVGYGTIEEIKLENGRYMNDRLSTYIIPTAMDAPRITAILVEAPFSGCAARRQGRG